jgi:glycosyltransferase involved in cell wall biosynthesis
MRVLLVSEMVPYLPSHDGFRLIPANLIRQLGPRHELHLIALSQGESPESICWPRQYCRSYLALRAERGFSAKARSINGTLPPNLSQAVYKALQTTHFDVIHVEGAGLAALLRGMSPLLRKLLCIHDSKSLRYREFGHYAQGIRSRATLTILSSLAKLHERRWFGYADKVVVTSPGDAKALAGAVPVDRIATIPNGVDLEYFAYRSVPEKGRIVFTGNMSWPPNEDAAERFANAIFPSVRALYPEASFWIVGADPSERIRALERLPDVHVTGTVLDLRPWLWSAAVYVSPLRFGMGVKNKILEAMASGAPIVATSRSLSGTPLSDREHAMIANEDREIADAVVELLRDPALAHKISAQARQKAEEEHGWEATALRYEQLYSI